MYNPKATQMDPTQMEEMRVLCEGKYPKNFHFISKSMRELLQSMISREPNQRPEASRVVEICDHNIIVLKNRLASQEIEKPRYLNNYMAEAKLVE
jgi:hypothetical protein